MWPFSASWRKDAKLANYRFSAGKVNQLQSQREPLQLATLGMYAGLWKHCMVILPFISFIVLISAVGRGAALSNLITEHCVLGSLTYGRSWCWQVSAYPPLPFYMELAHPWFLLSLHTTQQQPQTTKDNKRRGEKTADLAICKACHSPTDTRPKWPLTEASGPAEAAGC